MLSKLSVKKPYTVVVSVLLVLILGVVAFTEMTPDLLPSINLPYAVVMTNYQGATPEEVEMVVTGPIEQSMATLSNINNITSTSSENVSLVVLEFTDDVNMDAMTVDIREKLDMISGFWSDSVGSPMIMKLNPDMMPVMVAAVDSDNMSREELAEYVDETIIPGIKSVEGVASVAASGMLERQLNVVLRQDKIDEINEKLAASVEAKLSDAEDQLSDAKDKISSGKTELDSKSEELSEGMSKAAQQIKEGRLEILKKELEIESQEKELIKKEEEVKTHKEELLKKETELLEGENQANGALEALKLMGADQTEEGKEKVAELEAALTQIAEGKKQIAEGKTALEAGEKQMAAGKEQLELGKQELIKAKEALYEKETELEKQKAAAQSQMTTAKGQMESGEKELESQLDSFDEQKKDSLKNANVNDKITADMISKILQAQNFSMPAGYITEENVDYLVRVGDKIEDEAELSELVLFDLNIDDMEPVTLSDVADVFWTDNADELYAKINGNDGIILSMQKQTTYSTADVADRLSEKLSELEKNQEGIHTTALMDQGMYIHMVVDSVLNNLMIGAVLAVIILLLFLKDIRPTFVIACSIPISVVFAIVLMYFSGVTLNIISLSGLAVGVGMLVDNSVVVIENIYRLRSKGVSAVKSAVTGATQVAGALISSTLTTVCVFLPIVFVKGITRELFTDMALTIGYSLLASLIVALSLVPMMASGLLKNTKEKKHPIFDRMMAGYKFLIWKALKFKPVVLLLAVVILIASVYGAMSQGTGFMPDMDSTQISVALKMPEDGTMEDTIEESDKAMELIQEVEGVDTVGAMISGGQAAMMGMSSGGKQDYSNVSMYVILNEDKNRSSQEIAKEIEEKCKELTAEVTASGSSMDMSALGGSGIVIQIRGQELSTLQSLANEVSKKLETIEGTQNVSNGIKDPDPELRITIDKEKAMLKGITVASAYMELKNAVSESVNATELSMDGSSYQIVVSSDDKESIDREFLENYTFKTTDAEGKEKKVKLKNIAEITEGEALSSISHDAQQRYISVTAEIAEGYNIGLVSEKVEKEFKDFSMPEGYELVFSGENETINEAMFELVKMLLLAIAFIYLIMVAQFQSVLSPFIVMFTIPLAFTGGFLGLYFTGNELSVIAMIGFVMLSGIVVNNGIVLVDYINQLRLEGAEKKEAIVEAGITRMRPILMTALTTILGLSTMAIGMGMGADMMQPVAIVTIGGLLYATITTLFVIPVLYDIFNHKELKAVSEEELAVYEEE